MTDVITKPASRRVTTQGSKPAAKRVSMRRTKRVSTPLIATACVHEVHELCHLTSCECGCHGNHD